MLAFLLYNNCSPVEVSRKHAQESPWSRSWELKAGCFWGMKVFLTPRQAVLARDALSVPWSWELSSRTITEKCGCHVGVIFELHLRYPEQLRGVFTILVCCHPVVAMISLGHVAYTNLANWCRCTMNSSFSKNKYQEVIICHSLKIDKCTLRRKYTQCLQWTVIICLKEKDTRFKYYQDT